MISSYDDDDDRLTHWMPFNIVRKKERRKNFPHRNVWNEKVQIEMDQWWWWCSCSFCFRWISPLILISNSSNGFMPQRFLKWPTKLIRNENTEKKDPTTQVPGAVVLAQLVEWSLPTPEVPGLYPVIGKNILNVYYQLDWKDENKEKEAGIGTF